MCMKRNDSESRGITYYRDQGKKFVVYCKYQPDLHNWVNKAKESIKT